MPSTTFQRQHQQRKKRGKSLQSLLPSPLAVLLFTVISLWEVPPQTVCKLVSKIIVCTSDLDEMSEGSFQLIVVSLCPFSPSLLTLSETGSVRGSTVLTNSACSQNDDKSQIQNFWTYDINANEIKFVGSKSSGPHHPVSLSLSSVNHRAVKLNPVDNANGAYLSLGREILL